MKKEENKDLMINISLDRFQTYIDEIDDINEKVSRFDIVINGAKFSTYIYSNDMEEEYKKIPLLADTQYSVVDAILALEKLSQFLRLSIDNTMCEEVLIK